MTTKVTGTIPLDGGELGKVQSSILDGEGELYNLHTDFARAGLYVRDVRDKEYALFKVSGTNRYALNQVIIQSFHEGYPLKPALVTPGEWFEVPKYVTFRITGSMTEKGQTPVLHITYEGPASTKSRDRK